MDSFLFFFFGCNYVCWLSFIFRSEIKGNLMENKKTRSFRMMMFLLTILFCMFPLIRWNLRRTLRNTSKKSQTFYSITASSLPTKPSLGIFAQLGCYIYPTFFFFFWFGHRILELEIYCTCAQHDDPYTHCDPVQYTTGNWYFHKMGKGYKGG